ncbi:MAG: DUF1444 family protein [Planctomycetaceae bacterium]|nr:DUF1444 family protein [Planctomycetaceae bacterium]
MTTPENTPDPFSGAKNFTLSDQLVTGPSNWFQLRCPAWCEIQQTESRVEVRPARWRRGATALSDQRTTDCRPVFTIQTEWLPAVSVPEESSLSRTFRRFPRIVASRPESDSPSIYPSQCWSGLSQQPAQGGFFQRLWHRPQIFQWWFCILRNAQVQITASVQSAPGLLIDEQFLATCMSMMDSLVLPDYPAMPAEVFRQRVIDLANHRFPLLRFQAGDAFSVQLDHSRICLKNLYQRYVEQPEFFEQISLRALTDIVRMHELGPLQLSPSLSETTTRILPIIVPLSEATRSEQVYIPWVGDLAISFIIDDRSTCRIVDYSLAGHWQISSEHLYQIAVTNLAELDQRCPLEFAVTENRSTPLMAMPVTRDSFNSSRLLCNEFRERLINMLGEQVVVSVPEQELFLATPLHSSPETKDARQRVDARATNPQHPLSKCLLIISADGVSEYTKERPLNSN